MRRFVDVVLALALVAMIFVFIAMYDAKPCGHAASAPSANMVAPIKVYGHGDTVDGAAYCVFGEVYLAANDGVMMPVLRGMADPIRCEE